MLILLFISISIDPNSYNNFYLIRPGNLLDRVILPYPEITSRLILIFYIILYFLLEFISKSSNHKLQRLSQLTYFLAWALENLNFIKLIEVPTYLTICLWSIALTLYLVRTLDLNSNSSKSNPLVPFLLYILLITPLHFIKTKEQPDLKALHYYLWFPENWKAGYGDNLKKPSLGEYASTDETIIKTHIKDIKNRGYNLILLDWWPKDPFLKQRAFKFISVLKEHPEINFAIHFETLSIGHDQKSDLITLTDEKSNELASFFKYPAKTLFNNPQYLKIDNKPAVFLYASRHLVGKVIGGMNKIRKTVKENSGLEPFLIGDEIFFNVPEGNNSKSAKLLPKFIPAWDRLRAFDAITLYNPYDPTRYYESLETNDTSQFLIETNILYDKYKDTSWHLGIPFYPTIIPSYNDKAVRPKLSHQIIPKEDKNSVNTLTALESISSQYKTNKHGPSIIITTSYNEWNEGTNVEE